MSFLSPPFPPLWRLFLVAITGLFVACSTAPGDLSAPTQYWSVERGEWLTPAAVAAAVTEADYLLLGEIHDNASHHRGQADLLRRFPGDDVAVGFEQLDSTQAPGLERAQASDEPLAVMPEAVAWADAGWPPWTLYEPVFAAALEAGHDLVALSFPRREAFAVAGNGFPAVLPDEALAVLAPDTLLDTAAQATLEQELADAHCGKLPAAMLPAMATVQVARDAHMAWRQVNAGERGVLVLGAGHARRDRAVPRFLERLRPEAKIAVVVFVERRPDAIFPADYPEAQPGFADFVAVTDAAERPDPCAGIAES
ncbi:ChaN family lipoprotein [Pseudohaliea rubra]|uniref:Putative Lipoprotein n=1 Tax=Pseudohaliea rubra DSM 19751 TaxID=1265313 RepID=A0A095VTB3_9GAMM|nr:ChaN family lipoprotein [Pseudohaliea rubra]KGE04338.1 putative Lipoprotein [Pseudohaliea rubra DSM 19751]